MNDTGMYARFEKELKLKGFAKRSIQSYLRAVRQLQNFCCKALEDITEEDVRSYWLYCKEDLRWGSATLRISYSGIQHFFNYVIKHDWPVFKGIRFEREVSLPLVLSIEDVRKILNALPEGQNRAFYQAVYSLGLRLGEARSLQVGDIDSKRMLVHVKRGKGNKDRLIPMPETTLLSLRVYYKTHRNPVWIFPGLGRDGKRGAEAIVHVSETTVQGALRRTMRKLNIHKHVHAHTFRHSYATHLIEAGVPVRHVQDFLGHVRALSRMFRGKMKAALAQAKLLSIIPEEVWNKNWVVHCESVGDGRAVMKCLGAYVFRVAISDSRIVSCDGKEVVFKYQKVGSSRWRCMKVSVFEFIRRFLQHVLPHGFMKVRHFGFMSPNFSVTIQRVREIICVLYEILRECPVRLKPPDTPKPLRCPKCKAVMRWIKFIRQPGMAFAT